MIANPRRRIAILACFVFLSACTLASNPVRAEKIEIGVIKLAIFGVPFIAKEKGYFAAEDLDAELVYFDAAPPIAVAVVSGDLDFAAAGFSAGFFNLASQGALRIIGGFQREAPGFPNFATVAATRAYEAGLKTYQDLEGHSVAVSQIGSPTHYSLALIEEKYRLDPQNIRLLPLQSNANMVSAVRGGQVDAAVIPATAILPAIHSGEVRLLGWNGDAAPWQVGSVFTATKTVNERRDTVERFLRAYRKAVRDFHDAFTSADEKRHDGPTAPEVLAIIAKYVDQPPEVAREGVGYVDREARLDVADVLHQIGWYKSQGMLKGNVDIEALIDKHYVMPLPVR
jgi:NitT/TauT family transport system substrate-binding protein